MLTGWRHAELNTAKCESVRLRAWPISYRLKLKTADLLVRITRRCAGPFKHVQMFVSHMNSCWAHWPTCNFECSGRCCLP